MKTVETKNLSKIYGNIQAVCDFSFSAKKGEIIALLGPNGAGKSTLMNMITGFLSPSSGEILINGTSIFSSPLEAKKAIGYLPEGSPLYPDISVRTFLKYMADLRGVKKEGLQKAIKAAHIENVLHQKIENLSKGYTRRVGFAQSILSDPEILLLDEPTDGLDPNQKEHMQELISQMGQNKTIIISTHLLDEAEAICSRILIINKGRLMVDGSLKQILEQTKSKSLASAFKKLTSDKGEQL